MTKNIYIFVSIFYLKLELLTQFLASNDEKYLYKSDYDYVCRATELGSPRI